MDSRLFLALAVSALVALRSWMRFRRAVHAVSNHPGYRTLLNTLGPIENFFPRIPYVTPGAFHMWTRKHRDFEEHGWDVITYVAAFIGSKTNFYVADAEAIKEITTHRSRFPKPVEQYRVLTFFGGNIVASEGDEWKRYRKIAAPAFSERNNRLVWDETRLVMQDLFAHVWGDRAEVRVAHAVDITLPIALFVIGSAGFGRRIAWRDEDAVPPGHTLTFKEALHTVSEHVFVRLLIPDWLLRAAPTARLARIRDAFAELELYMHEMIAARRAGAGADKEARDDLFGGLLDANDDDDARLQDSELIGNMFIFMLAGHETSAHTLCYMLALLAMHPEEQEKLYESIKEVCRDGRLPEYEDLRSLSYCEAVLYETLRMFPPVHSIPKSVAEDTAITITNAAGARTTVPMPKGSSISLHTPGLHYNPRYWADPHTFRPARFLADWPRDAFLPFSAGPRACLGRRFSETEIVAAAAMLVLRYRVEVPPDPRFVGESWQARFERVMQSRPGVTMTPLHVPLVFKLR
ncbi:cytochrome P450 [Phanerochaete sordida]|uniref:Cytochrome P450 n=1 Tax=Phanerochaete sordida TaxID=48140 RepID=A0A9P3L8Z4_9APHY|nr:cytochrome P450 [Phanerochaete sordida]